MWPIFLLVWMLGLPIFTPVFVAIMQVFGPALNLRPGDAAGVGQLLGYLWPISVGIVWTLISSILKGLGILKR